MFICQVAKTKKKIEICVRLDSLLPIVFVINKRTAFN